MKSKRILSLTLILTMLSANVAFADQALSSKKNYNQNNPVSVNSITGEVKYETLTSDQAAEKAIAYSHTLKTLSESRKESENTYDNTLRTFNDLIDTSTSTVNQQLVYGVKQLNIAMRSINANEQIAVDGIYLSVDNLFNSILAAEDDIKLHEENMVIQEKDIKVAEVKRNLGLMSQLEYESTVNNYNTTKDEKESLEIAVNEAYRSLNELMGTDLNKKYELVYDEVEYEPMGDVNISSAIERALSTAETIKSKKDALTLAEFDYKTYVPDATQVGQSITKKNAVYQATRDLETAETNLKTSMTNLYDTITELEQTYTDTKNSLSVLQSQYEVIKAQYEMGKATETDVLTVEYNIHKAEAGLDKIIRNHDILVKQFNNPNLIQ